jgi:hypothetical protein
MRRVAKPFVRGCPRAADRNFAAITTGWLSAGIDLMAILVSRTLDHPARNEAAAD